MQPLDVEQQLRLLQQERQRSAAATRLPPVAFVSWRCYAGARRAALALTACTCLVACAAALALRRGRARYAAAWQHAQLASARSLFSRDGFVLALLAYALLICANGVLSCMKFAAEHEQQHGRGSTPRWREATALYVYALETAGVVGLAAHVLTAAPHKHGAGVVAALALFFPSMWQSLQLRAGEVERAAMWLTHVVFLSALYLLYATAAPYLRHEYAIVKRELHAHTRRALDRERRGAQQLLAHTQRRTKQP